MKEADLIRLAKQGNEKAFTTIFNMYRLPLYNFILYRVRSEADAEDLTMESFERAFASIIYFVPLFKLKTWLFKIAKNRIIDYIRAKRISPQMCEYDHTISDNLTPDTICIYNQELRIIQDGIRGLQNDKHKKVMIMYCQGWKMKEIALELKIPLGTVVGYVHRSKGKLKELVA